MPLTITTTSDAFPAAPHAARAGDALLLHGLVASIDGTRIVRGAQPFAAHDAAAAADAGARLARELRARGAEELLQELRQLSPVPRPQPE